MPNEKKRRGTKYKDLQLQAEITASLSRPKRKLLPPRLLFDRDKILFLLMRYNVLVRASRRELIIYSTDDLFLTTSLREILLALRVTPTPKAPPIISLLFKYNLLYAIRLNVLRLVARKFPPKAYTRK
ncbi:hypothetical protein L249_4264 [Ophiocordyceps polyrhachis-furcata BCC 54312]|uniref:Uncharacterized protein n=1 Tax=Ophiocordyceps polyrhachis-furcata BCC 54312 TaxID=1330021 RepID=A0A367L870_9HYPO|nr:hypothetical protein L249_4264 [Ophiocordyceps polyrhachis-furcata BCC 54312]